VPTRIFASDIQFKTASYTESAVVGTEHLIVVEAKNDPKTPVMLTLPPAAENRGRIVFVRRIDKNHQAIVIMNPHLAETIDGGNTLNITVQAPRVIIFCDGITWHTLAVS
jgi:hypothetical protein